jgi:cytochrome c peroxidase
MTSKVSRLTATLVAQSAVPCFSLLSVVTACSATSAVERRSPDADAPCTECSLDAGSTSEAVSAPQRDAAAPHVSSAAPDTGSTTEANELDASLSDAGGPVAAFEWNLPPGFPEPAVPADNPMSAAKVTLGRHLFYDVRLSRDDSKACATCHKQELAFTDGLPTSIGLTGQHTPRNSMMLGNVAYASTLTWANPLLLELERQALVPMFGDNPVELGLRSERELEEKLATEPLYHELFERAFPSEPAPITTRNAVFALASFQRTFLSGNSPFDAFLYGGDKDALSAAARRGYELFNAEKLECFHCHVGFNLSDHVTWRDKPFIDRPYHNTGLYDIDGEGGYPAPNTGVHSVTGNPKDMGRFRAPSLRNIAVTAPYMHDGSIATLSEVLDHYAAGGREISSGPNAGKGSKSPLKNSLIVSFDLSDDERRDVLEFLESLTDASFLTDEQFSNPWPAAER